jgi:hypothetical protein
MYNFHRGLFVECYTRQDFVERFLDFAECLKHLTKQPCSVVYLIYFDIYYIYKSRVFFEYDIKD